MILGGSHEPSLKETYKEGDLSAIIMDNLPLWVNIHRTPSRDIALLNDFEHKIEQIAKISSQENVTNIAGVPSDARFVQTNFGTNRELAPVRGMAQFRVVHARWRKL